MKKIGASIIVGMVVFAGIVVLVVLFGNVKSKFKSKKDTYKLYAYFPNASGLVENSRILIAGIPVGYIEKIELDQSHQKSMAKITVRISKKIKLYEGVKNKKGEYVNGATIRKSQSSVLGDYFLEISPGVQGKVLKDGDVIRNVIGETGLEAMISKFEVAGDTFKKIEKLVSDLSEITENLRRTFGGEQGAMQMKEITKNIAKATEDIQNISGELRKFIKKSVITKSDDLSKIITNLRSFSENAYIVSEDIKDAIKLNVKKLNAIVSEVKNLMGKSGPDVKKSLTRIKVALKKVEVSLNKLDKILDNITSITNDIKEGKGTVGKLLQDDTLIRNLQGISEDVSDFTSKISRLETKIQINTDYNYYEQNFKTYFSLKLMPKQDKYYLFALIDDPRGNKTVVRKEIKSSDNPYYWEEITETTSKLKFSLQFAKRFYFITWRIGLFENTGGLGVDFDFLNNHLTLTSELFDFDMNKNPRLKSFLKFSFLKYFFVSIGVDDILNKDTRDYIFGAGLIFKDEDLKTILTTSPSISF